MSHSSQILWSVSVRAICQQGIVQSRARGILAIIPQNVEQTRASAPHFTSATHRRFLGGWIAAAHSLGSEVLARAIERTRTPIALARANISTRVGLRRLICKIRWPQQAASKLFTSPLVQDANQSTRGISYGLELPPILSSVLVNHAHKKARSYEHVAHEKSVNGA